MLKVFFTKGILAAVACGIVIYLLGGFFLKGIVLAVVASAAGGVAAVIVVLVALAKRYDPYNPRR